MATPPAIKPNNICIVFMGIIPCFNLYTNKYRIIFDYLSKTK